MHLYKSIKEIRDFSRKFPHKIIDNVRAVISSLNSKGKKLHALRYTDIDFSLYQAKQLNSSNSSLPLFGVPLAHKELFGRYIKHSNSWPFEGGSKSLTGNGFTESFGIGTKYIINQWYIIHQLTWSLDV